MESAKVRTLGCFTSSRLYNLRVKQVYGVEASALEIQPSLNIGEVTITLCGRVAWKQVLRSKPHIFASQPERVRKVCYV